MRVIESLQHKDVAVNYGTGDKLMSGGRDVVALLRRPRKGCESGLFEWLVFGSLIFCLSGCEGRDSINDKDRIGSTWRLERRAELSGAVVNPFISSGRIRYGSHVDGNRNQSPEIWHSAWIDSPSVPEQHIQVNYPAGIHSFDFINDEVCVAQSLYEHGCVYFLEIDGDKASVQDSICGDLFFPTSVQVCQNWLIVHAFSGLFFYDKNSKILAAEFLTDFPSQRADVQYFVEDDCVYVFSSALSGVAKDSAKVPETVVYKMNVDNLKVEWKSTMKGELYGGTFGDVHVLDQNVLVFLKDNQPFVGLVDKADGTILWKSSNFEDLLYRAYEVPGLVCVDTQNFLIALDKESGKEKWMFRKGKPVGTYGFRDGIICSMDKAIGSFDLDKREVVNVFDYSHRSFDVLRDEHGKQYLLIDSTLFW